MGSNRRTTENTLQTTSKKKGDRFWLYKPNKWAIDHKFRQKGNFFSFKRIKKNLYDVMPIKKVILYVDDVRFHHTKLLKEFMKNNPKLEIQYLPVYSPDLNPAERVW